MNLKRRLQNLEAKAADTRDAERQSRQRAWHERRWEFSVAMNTAAPEILDLLRSSKVEGVDEATGATLAAEYDRRSREWALANGFGDVFGET